MISLVHVYVSRIKLLFHFRNNLLYLIVEKKKYLKTIIIIGKLRID